MSHAGEQTWKARISHIWRVGCYWSHGMNRSFHRRTIGAAPNEVPISVWAMAFLCMQVCVVSGQAGPPMEPVETFHTSRRVMDRHEALRGDRGSWLIHRIPLFECPDPLVESLYYYRWEVVRRHTRFISPQVRHIFTEFDANEPLYWARTRNSIVAAVDHHVREGRWPTPSGWSTWCTVTRAVRLLCWIGWWRITGDR